MYRSIVITLLACLFIISVLTRSWWQGNQCPHTIKTRVPNGRIPNGKGSPKFDTMAAVHQSLTSCPNVAALDLRVTLLGCSEWPDRWNFPFKLSGGDRYPPLKKLRLEGYRFEEKEWDETSLEGGFFRGPSGYERLLDWVGSGDAWRHMRYIMLDRTQRTKTNLDLWLDAMDWTQLESFAWLGSHTQSSFPPHVALRLNSLRQLELASSSDTPQYQLQFISGLRNHSLERFAAIGAPLTPLIPLLEHQGKSLKRLQIRAPETMQSSLVYDKSELTRLPLMAPSLTHLSINLHRNGTWPLEVLEIIASNPSLRSVDLWLDLVSDCRRQMPTDYFGRTLVDEKSVNCAGEDRFQRPFVNETSSLELFKYMREKKIGDDLVNATFWLGDWERSYDGPLNLGESWLEGRQKKVVCSVVGKSEGVASCEVVRSIGCEDSIREYWEEWDEDLRNGDWMDEEL